MMQDVALASSFISFPDTVPGVATASDSADDGSAFSAEGWILEVELEGASSSM